jgi:uncharacterized protein Yka (UPF0111/DUF47 family)
MEREDILMTLTEHDNRIKVAEHRISDLEERTDRISEMQLSIQKLALSVEQMCKEIEKQSSRLAVLEKEPADTWRLIQKTILTAIVSGVVGYMLASLV